MTEQKEIHVEIEKSKVNDIAYVTSKLLEVCKEVIRDIADKNEDVTYEELMQKFLPQFTDGISSEIPKKKKKKEPKKTKTKTLSVKKPKTKKKKT